MTGEGSRGPLPAPALVRLALLLLTVSFGWGAVVAHAAPPPLALEQDLDGVALGHHVMVWEDPTSLATITRVSSPSFTGFASTSRASPSFGYSSSSYWLRFSVSNAKADPR